MIVFNKPVSLPNEMECLNEVITSRKLSGDGIFTKKCNLWFEEKLAIEKALLTTSCTHALELAAILIDIQEGDEVIMSSYTFVSTANAFILRGAKAVFVDIDPKTMNIDANLIEAAITKKTKAIVAMHYAGVACDMDAIQDIAERHNLFVVEDAAQGMMSTYKGKPLGAIGDIGTYSFHETKNYTMGEGGCVLIKENPKFSERAEIIREKGTDRSKFYRGEIDKYTWVSLGSSYLPSELNAAYLFPQLKAAEEINNKRLALWDLYYGRLSEYGLTKYLDLPHIPENCQHNAHMFYIKAKNIEERSQLINYLKDKGIMAVFHYIPLHLSTTDCRNYFYFHGEDVYTTKESERLIRLPLFYELEFDSVEIVCKAIKEFYENK